MAKRDGDTPEFDEEFAEPDLAPERWLPHYLPHWSSRAAARARYGIADSALTLRIDPDQAPWCPEFDGAVKVSSLQTGQYAGPVGSAIGQHRFNPAARVREAQPEARLYLPHFARIEMRARADLGINNLAALWLIGFEEHPDDSGEITVMEIFGRNVTPAGTQLGHGIKRVTDPRLSQDFHEDLLAFDPADWHVYAADWTPAGVDFFLDGMHLRHVAQAPDYPMQLMLNIYELPGAPTPARGRPATFTIDYVRGYSRG